MSSRWRDAIVRCSVYLYFAGAMAILVSPGMAAALHYQQQKTFPATFLLITTTAIFGLLTLVSWDTFWRPINVRRWIVLCALASGGVFEFIFAPPFFGSGAGA